MTENKFAKSSHLGTFKGINQILNKVVNKLGLDKRLREHTLINMWPNFVSDIIASRSRILYIDAEANLVISAADAVIAQELSLQKKQLHKTISIAATALDLQVKGIRFDLKHFHNNKANNNEKSENISFVEALPKISKVDLDLFSLNTNDKQELELFREEIKNKLQQTNEKSAFPELIDESVERFSRAYEKALKLKAWQRSKGYPICRLCNDPSPRLYAVNDTQVNTLCFTCYLQNK